MRGNAQGFKQQRARTKVESLAAFRTWLHMAREEKVLATSVAEAQRMYAGADVRLVECELLAKQALLRRRAAGL